MKIATKTGDSGMTGLLGGVRVPKSDLIVQVCGSLDEGNSWLGLVLSELACLQEPQAEAKRGGDHATLSLAEVTFFLQSLQGALFQLGGELAQVNPQTLATWALSEQALQALEEKIEQLEAQLPDLRTFILPGGAKPGAMLHLTRTVIRRAERDLVAWSRAEVRGQLPVAGAGIQAVRPLILAYLNRLSDFLFLAARWFNRRAAVTELPWIAPPANLK